MMKALLLACFIGSILSAQIFCIVKGPNGQAIVTLCSPSVGPAGPQGPPGPTGPQGPPGPAGTVTLQQILTLLTPVPVPIATFIANNPGALYWTPDGINAISIFVGGTPAQAAMVQSSDGTRQPVFAYSRQDASGKDNGLANWVPIQTSTPITPCSPPYTENPCRGSGCVPSGPVPTNCGNVVDNAHSSKP